ncbi:catecholate siderophore receptor [Sulfuritortus calidifontis]|uniref:Catecholate siderophore receptor n=1 Tax=Sulfuritortus calidifontis TaxID=1914471 RepID=A0A4R3JTU3_9PROT|nr:catecholate siderophore receptor [Sulfuritortus calidifontis]
MPHKKKFCPGKVVRPVFAEDANSGRKPALLPLGAMMMAGLSLSALAEEAPRAATGEQVLSTVAVEADVETEQDGYRATVTRVGKTLQDPHDIPQAVTTVTNKLMEEQQVGSLREALRNVSGLTFNAAEGGRSGDNMMLRGFYTFGDMYLDGIRDTAQYNRETFNLEQVDVLRGSAAMLFGRGQAGGVINQVSKTPLLTDRHKISGSLGSNEYGEATGDFNKRLGRTSAIRVNVMKRDEGSWRENPATGAEPDLHRYGLAVSLGLGISTDDEFILSHIQTRTRDNPDYGVPFDSATKRPTKKYPADYFWGVGANFDDSDTSMTTLSHQHRFSTKAELRTQLRYAHYQRAYWASAPSNTTPPDADGNSPKTRKMDTENLTLQSDFNARFDALGMKHEFLAGFEYLNEDATRWSLSNLGSFPYYSKNVVGAPTTYNGETYAVYFQDSIEFMPQWKLLFGVRRDQLDAEYSSLTSPKLNFGEWSLRTGLSWQPSEVNHYYLSFSDSFSPTADLYQLSGGAYPPERSQVVELGVKKLLLDGDLALRAALYRADKEYERNTDLESSAAILTNRRRTDGIEFEAAGRINERWEVFAGLALMNAKILEVAVNRDGPDAGTDPDVADARLKGQKARNTPDYTFNLWTTYKLAGSWKLGGGVEAKGKRLVYVPSTQNANSLFADGRFTPNTAPAYVRWDAMLAYEQKQYTVRLNVQNLFDKVYYDAVYDNGGFTVPGIRRRLLLTGEFKF